MINTHDITPQELNELGLKALVKALGPVGMVRFLRQYERGQGDYTKERHQWLDKVSSKEFAQAIFRRQAASAKRARGHGKLSKRSAKRHSTQVD